MKKADVTCLECGAGFRRKELSSLRGAKKEYRCPSCDSLIEALDGGNLVMYRLTVPSSVGALRPMSFQK